MFIQKHSSGKEHYCPKWLCNPVTVLSLGVLYDCENPIRFKMLNNGVTVLTIEPHYTSEQTIETHQLPAGARLVAAVTLLHL